jgi:endonuclease III
VAFLEANYDEKMLLDGRYPHHLKQRIHGNNGHLSNNQALELFLHHRSEKLTHLILSHLSQENNSPDIVEQLFNKHPTPTQILIASRTEASAFLHFPDSNSQYQKKVVQAKLFE